MPNPLKITVMKKNFGILFAAVAAMFVAAVGCLFVGCDDGDLKGGGGDGYNPYPTYGHVTQLEGTVIDEYGALGRETGPFTVKLCVPDHENYTDVPVASCPLSADGSFSLELPESIDPALYWNAYFAEPAEGVTVSDESANFTVLQGSGLWLYDGEGNECASVHYLSPEVGHGHIMYADRDCQISGTRTGEDGGGNIISDTYYLKFKKGWNWWFMHDGENGNVSLRTEIPSDAGYYLGVFQE
jgi:hypothetical protein